MDLFVLHAPADAPFVHGYLLPELGLPEGSVRTPADFTPGASRAAELERAVTGARVVLLVLTPAFLDDTWSELGEQLASHAAVGAREGRLVPLVLQPCRLPLRVEFLVQLDCTSQDRWDDAVGRLRRHLDHPGPPPAAEPIPCPYPGMVAFGEAEAGFFFGRAGEADDLARRLPRQGLVMVIGPSGSGKTSLVFAGLLPRLAAPGTAGWVVRTLRPGATPARALARALAGRPPAGTRLLLVVDQLEELFAQAAADERDRFLAELVRLRADPACTLLLTMRADFYPDLMDSVLWPLTEGERLELAPLRDQALRDAIAEPAARVGVYLERALVERLAADAAHEPGVLPLLQETMAMLWERRVRRLLTLEAYAELGGDSRSGLATALATQADAAFAGLSPARQAIARRLMLRLVQLGEGRDDTRRQQPVAALRAAGDDPAEFDATLRHLTRHRLLTLGGGELDPGQDASRADLAHEALIAAWPSLRRWVDEDRQGLRIRAQLADDVQVWTELDRDPDTPYRGARLLAATEWAERHPGQLTDVEQEFLAAGRRRQADQLAEAREHAAAQARAARRLRWSAAALGVLLVLAVVAGLLAVRSAGQERHQARIANSRYLANQASTTAASDPDLSILLSLAAYADDHSLEARHSLQDQLVRRRHVRRILTAADGPLGTVAFNRDGRVLAAGGADGRVRVWDGNGQALLATLGPVPGPVRAVAVSPDGRTVAASGADGTRLWDLADPGRPRPLGDGADRTGLLAFTRDGQLLAAGQGARIDRWDLRQGRRAPLATSRDGPVEAMAATPDGRGVVTLTRHGASLWRLDGRLAARFPLAPPTSLTVRTGGDKGAIAVSSDGRRLAVTRQDGGTKVWDLARRALTMADRYTVGTGIAFGPGDDTVALVDRSGDLHVNQPNPMESGPPGLKVTAQLSGHAGDAVAVAGRPDGLLASAGADGRVILWTTRPSTNTLTDPSIEAASRVGFSQDGRRLMVADGNGVVLFDVARRARLGQLDGPADAAITPDGRTVATGGVGSVVALYDLDSRKLEGRLRWAPRQLRVATFGVEISPDGRQLVEKSQLLRPGRKQGELGYKEQYLVVWDLPGRRTLRRLRIGPPAFYGLDTDSDLAFSPDSRVLAYARNDSAEASDPDLDRVALWDTRDRRELDVVDTPGVEALAFGRGGDVLALGFIDRVELRDAHHPGSVLQTIRVPKWTAQNLAVSPDGRLLATSGSQGALLWELGRPGDLPVLAGTLVDRQDLGSGGLDSDVAFSPDGRHLAVADDGSEIYLWDLDAGSWTQTLCHMLDRGFTGPERRRFFPDGRVPPTCEG